MPTTRRVVSRASATHTRKPRARTTTRRKHEGGAVRRRVVRKTTVTKATKATRSVRRRKAPTIRRRAAILRTAKGKPRGDKVFGKKYASQVLKDMWAKARKEGRLPTTAEKSAAFKKAHALRRGKA